MSASGGSHAPGSNARGGSASARGGGSPRVRGGGGGGGAGGSSGGGGGGGEGGWGGAPKRARAVAGLPDYGAYGDHGGASVSPSAAAWGMMGGTGHGQGGGGSGAEFGALSRAVEEAAYGYLAEVCARARLSCHSGRGPLLAGGLSRLCVESPGARAV
jgi:hypothetical protein